MTRRNKFRLSPIAMGLFWPAFIASAQAAELNLYAGPQSITPREMIHVTVQSTVLETAIELSYNIGDGVVTQTGITEQGLISFVVTPQDSVGQMHFTAQAGEVISNMVLVSVLAGPPQNFTLSAKQGMQAGTVEISSDIITDKFENSISDLTLATLDWIDERGLNASQNVQLTQGRIILNAKCPSDFTGTLKLRAIVNSTSGFSSDLSSFCRVQAKMDAR